MKLKTVTYSKLMMAKKNRMKIGLIDVDGHNFPNLALMKISAYHKAKGDRVEWCIPLCEYDLAYQSKVFDETYSRDIDFTPRADKIIKGGTGYGLDNKLPDEIEHVYPDYSLYPELTKDTAFGYLTRGCPRNCHFCIVSQKEGRYSRKVADLSEFWRGQRNVKLLDPNILACPSHIELFKQLVDSKAYIDFTQGLDARLLTIRSIELINRMKIKEIHFAWDYMKEEAAVINGLKLYAANAKHKPHGHYGVVYCLTNYDTTIDQDLYRIYKLRDMNYDPYVMIYDKPSAPPEIKRLQRWCNNKIIFGKVKRFEDYNVKSGKE